ncbi:methionine ABC transporter ATP-binding protein [Bacillus fonticola]|uniref:methionine ABC transporter ATP-binding protein n=1 Tax=Bacillus fonticola TaxID=2728853 RepID=UPI0014736F76|nr:methionine ABC transporter ATP-binding protein [Bacillus fonticola]
MISISNVSKVFRSKGKEVRAVDGVNLDIQQGEVFGIIGYSGAGKSTLLRMLNGLEQPTEGSVNIAGTSISTSKGVQLRKARHDIGMIFQHFHLLWSRTVAENIAFPLEIAGVSKAKRAAKVKELIDLVGLTGRESAYPSQLSGGQKQRVGIARALANDPKVLLCDEATSALDPETTDSILQLLSDINERLGLTIVLITHEMHVIQKICHHVAVMEDGKVVESGTVLRVFQHPEQPVTKRFVQQVVQPEEATVTIEHLMSGYTTGKIIRLQFVGETAEQPIVNELIRRFDIRLNILQGKISQLQDGSYGNLFVHLDGSDVTSAVEWLREQHVGVEVIT